MCQLSAIYFQFLVGKVLCHSLVATIASKEIWLKTQFAAPETNKMLLKQTICSFCRWSKNMCDMHDPERELRIAKRLNYCEIYIQSIFVACVESQLWGYFSLSAPKFGILIGGAYTQTLTTIDLSNSFDFLHSEAVSVQFKTISPCFPRSLSNSNAIMSHLQWRIQGGAPMRTCPPPPPHGPKFSQFHAVFRKIR